MIQCVYSAPHLRIFIASQPLSNTATTGSYLSISLRWFSGVHYSEEERVSNFYKRKNGMKWIKWFLRIIVDEICCRSFSCLGMKYLGSFHISWIWTGYYQVYCNSKPASTFCGVGSLCKPRCSDSSSFSCIAECSVPFVTGNYVFIARERLPEFSLSVSVLGRNKGSIFGKIRGNFM